MLKTISYLRGIVALGEHACVVHDTASNEASSSVVLGDISLTLQDTKERLSFTNLRMGQFLEVRCFSGRKDSIVRAVL